MKLFKNLFHVTLFVNDIDISLEFYNKLGFELLFAMSDKPGEKPWNYYLRIAHDQFLELQTTAGAAPAPHPSPERVVRHADSSMWHYALQTENLGYTINNLIEAGITVWKDPEKSAIISDISSIGLSADGCLVAWLIDPDGNPIEIMEQVGETLQRKYDYQD